MSKHNNSGNGGKTQPNPNEEKFRQETKEAMENDLMAVDALVPSGVVVALPTADVNRPQIESQSGAETQPSPAQDDVAAPVPGTVQILTMLQAGTIKVDEAERLLCALKNVAPAAPQPLPYIGGVEGKATRKEIAAVVKEAYGEQLAGMTRNNTEMLEVMGAMVDKIVRGLREPSDEEKAQMERKKLDRQKLIKEQFEMIKQQRDVRDMCPHERATADGKSHTCITALHNYIDNVLRGTCGLCQDIMEPGNASYKQVILSHNLAVSSAA